MLIQAVSNFIPLFAGASPAKNGSNSLITKPPVQGTAFRGRKVVPMLIRSLLLVVLMLPLSAQTPTPPNPAYFGAIGAAYGKTTKPSGWFNFCTKASESTYACTATDFLGTTSSTRVGLEKILWQTRGQGAYLTLKLDGGVASGQSGSTGGSYGGGFSAAIRLRGTHYLVFSATELKSNVNSLSSTGALQRFGAALVFRLGIGKVL